MQTNFVEKEEIRSNVVGKKQQNILQNLVSYIRISGKLEEHFQGIHYFLFLLLQN